MAGFFERLFNSSSRDIDKLKKKIAPIEALADEYAAMDGAWSPRLF